MKIRDVNHL